MADIPEDATDFIRTSYNVTYYKRVQAFNLNMLEYWNKYKDRWEMCGYHPWDELKPIQDL